MELLHTFEQQSLALEQVAPLPLHEEVGEQWPPLHTCEQHWDDAPHPAPSGSQGGGVLGAQYPVASQICEQHSDEVEHVT